MFLMHIRTGNLVRVEDPEELFDPLRDRLRACDQSGQEEQDPEWYAKRELVFPSGEALPRCWVDAGYREGK